MSNNIHNIDNIKNEIFSIKTEEEFNKYSLQIFNFQYENNIIYRKWVDYLKINPKEINLYKDIPFLPISLFKSHKICSNEDNFVEVFTSSGTTSSVNSHHYIHDLDLYKNSYLGAFNNFYGNIEDYTILALLPSYLERKGSSLIMMVEDLILKSKKQDSGFYLRNLNDLKDTLIRLKLQGEKVLLIGVSFALLEFAENYHIDFPELIVMETGGMKGRRKELLRSELHSILCKSFGVNKIHSEYGMTELLSQAYSKGDGIFKCPPWMKILIRESNDPLSLEKAKNSGGINIIDLCNIYSCSFISTQDLGKLYSDGSFEVLGRFDNSDVRGCNLMLI